MIGSPQELNLMYKRYVNEDNTLNISEFKNLIYMYFFMFIIYIYKMNILSEAIIVGLVVIIVGLLTKKIINCLEIKLPNEYEEYIILFMIGSMSHILFEFLGFNEWYCKNGNACK